jgi:SAM-dependent methyltransferase
VAVDPARGMLAQLQAKRADAAVSTVVAEGAHLPFRSTGFDVVIVARLLYLTPDWRAILHEARRVLAGGGCLLHEWSNGEADEEWVQIREHARRLFEHACLAAPFHPGVRSEAEVDRHLEQLQFVRHGQVVIGPGPEITLREFLRRLVDGELSYVWGVPEHLRAECLPTLQRWSEQTFDLDRPIAMPRQLRWTIHRKTGDLP